jgi:tetratricopeptide (TPR) repeat protein
MSTGSGDGPVADDAARARFRERVRREHPLSRQVDQHCVIEDLLARIEALDADIAGLVRSLDPDDARAFIDVLVTMRAAQLKIVPGGGEGTDSGAWLSWLRQNAGAADVGQRPVIDRMAALIALPDRLAMLRQLDPACLPPAPRVFTRPPDPQVMAAAWPLMDRYAAARPRIGLGMADAALSTELSELVASVKKLRDQQQPDTESWRFLQREYAETTSALGRYLAIQRHSAEAAAVFAEAAAGWKLIDQPAQAADCLARAAQATLTDGGDVDRALEPILRDLAAEDAGGRAAPSVRRARTLVRLAQIYLNAGDHFDAGARAEEAAGLLAELGFADPAGAGVLAAFRTWVAVDHDEDLGAVAGGRTQAVLLTVVEAWHGIIRVRMELRPGTPGHELQAELMALVRELGRESEQVHADLTAAARAFGTSLHADSERAEQARNEFAARQAEVSELLTELALLREEFERCEDMGGRADLLARTEALEARLLAGPLTGLAITVGTVRVLRSDLLSGLGRLDEAAALLAETRDRLAADPGLSDAERRSQLVIVLDRAAMTEGLRGDVRRSSRLSGEGIIEAEQDRGKVNGPYLQDDYLRFRGRLYATGIWAAKKTGDYDLMLARSELVKARGVLGWAVTGAPDVRADARADEAAFRKLTVALSRADGPPPGTGERTRMTAERRALWDRLMTGRTRSARLAAPPAFSLAALQAGLAPDEVVISYFWTSPLTLLVATIDGSAAVIEQFSLDDAQRATVDAAAASIGSIAKDEAPWLEQTCRQLGRLLLPKEGRGLLAGKQRLIVSPHRVLHQLPFHALGFDGAPLADRLAVSYVPNLTSLLLPPSGAGPRPVLALGVSSFAGQGFAPLPNAGREATEVCELYEQAGVPVTLVTDGQASAERIRELQELGALAGFGTLHLVTHGDNPPVSEPFDAGLHLPGGRIDGLEISQWQLRADLVVLSACNTARRAISGRGGPGGPDEELFGDEVLGLQAAFFAAGARQLLGALWPVADGSARTLMCAFHEQLAAGVPAESALRQAMAQMRATNLPMYHWAPYKLVRLGRAQGESTEYLARGALT